MSSTPFLYTTPLDCESDCLLCRAAIKKNSKTGWGNCSQDSWERLQNYAERWSHISLDFGHIRFNFTQVYACIKDKDLAFGKTHKKCRLKFFDHGLLEKLEQLTVPQDCQIIAVATSSENEVPFSDISTRSRNNSPTKSIKICCFVCITRRVSDRNPYNEGGLGRCGYEKARDKLISQMNVILQHPNHRFYAAAVRLHQMLSGSSTDVFFC